MELKVFSVVSRRKRELLLTRGSDISISLHVPSMGSKGQGSTGTHSAARGTDRRDSARLQVWLVGPVRQVRVR